MRKVFFEQELRTMSPQELERVATTLLRVAGLVDRVEASQRQFERRLIYTPQNGVRRPSVFCR